MEYFKIETSLIYKKAKTLILSSLHKLISPKPTTTIPGLKILLNTHQDTALLQPNPHNIQFYMLSPPPPSPPPSPPPPSPSFLIQFPSSPFFPALEDLIGTENGVYNLSFNEDIFNYDFNFNKGGVNRLICNKRTDQKITKNYPPPIPSLARAGSLPGGRPARILSRQIIDGRLVLKEEGVGEYHDYFEAHKEHGRFTLNLVQLDDDDHGDDDDHELLDFYSDGSELETEDQEEISSSDDIIDDDGGDVFMPLNSVCINSDDEDEASCNMKFIHEHGICENLSECVHLCQLDGIKLQC